MLFSRTTLRHALAVTLLGLSGILVFQVFDLQDSTVRAERTSTPAPSVMRPDLSADSVSSALERREELLTRTTVVNFTAADGMPVASWTVELADFPLWILFHRDTNGTVSIDRERVKQQLISYPPEDVQVPKQCEVLSSEEDEEGVTRVTTDCIARSGYTYDTATIADITASALENGIPAVFVPLTEIQATIKDPLHSPEKPLTLLSTGRSAFAGSGLGRKSNVRKAINEREHNVLVPKDGVFAFNDTLGKVTVSNGWQQALTIFEGVNLRPAPGGGICQASTTMFRAALNAGLPILEHKNHSLYVTYYETYGVGLDATIFPGLQDLKFKNDTGGPILVQAYTEGDEAVVNIYGIDDHRTVTLEGPYFASTAPEDLRVKGKKVGGNQIVWLRTVHNGAEVSEDVISAKYNAIPRSLPKKWEAKTVITRGTPEMIADKEVIASGN